MDRKRLNPRPTVALSESQPASVGGLNTKDGVMNMPRNDAIDLVNWIAQQFGVRTRKGYKEWAINLGAEVRTIMEYAPDRSSIINRKLFAVTDAAVYDITSSTNVPPVSTALPGTDSYGRFTNTMMSNLAGTFLLCCSNQGGYRYYDGAAWVVPTFGVGVGQVSGVDPVNLKYIQMWKRRSWFVEKGTTTVWYSDVDSLTGVFHPLNVGPFMEHGGVLSFVARWSIDAGEGIDDFLIIGGENGDILIYKGTDPSSATTFGLVGVWFVGKIPVGHRATCEFGGDLLVLTANGMQPVSYVTRGGQSLFRTSSVDYLDKIQPRLADLLTNTSDQFGWEVVSCLEENLIVVTVPPNGTSIYDQYALYTNGNTWCRFSGMNMATAFSGQLGFFFGSTDGKVYQAFTGYFDNIPYGSTVGNGIPGIIQTAYSYFNRPGMNKQWHLVRPTFIAADRPSVSISVVADFQQNILSGSPVYGIPTGDKWDIARWDQARWQGGLTVYNDWYGAGALGYAGSTYMTTVCVGDTFLTSIDHQFENGGVL